MPPKYEIQRILRGFKYVSGSTHMIHIPLATKISRPQLSSSLGSLATDPHSASIPREAFRWLDNLRIGLAAVVLPTDTARQSVVELITELIKRKLAEPLIINMQGLDKTRRSSLPFDKTALKTLFASISDSTGGLSRLVRDIRQCLRREGFLQYWRNEKFFFDEAYVLSRAVIVDTSRCTTGQPSSMPKLAEAGLKKNLRKRFDATEISKSYKSHVWAKDFPLERVAISEMGLKHIVRNGMLVSQGYHEVASIPLPGSPEGGNDFKDCSFVDLHDDERRPPPYIMQSITDQTNSESLMRNIISRRGKVNDHRGSESGIVTARPTEHISPTSNP